MRYRWTLAPIILALALPAAAQDPHAGHNHADQAATATDKADHKEGGERSKSKCPMMAEMGVAAAGKPDDAPHAETGPAKATKSRRTMMDDCMSPPPKDHIKSSNGKQPPEG